MKAPGHPVPSGDRQIARRLIDAFGEGGHTVSLASTFSSYDGNGDDERQRRLAAIGARTAQRLIARYRSSSESERPEVWFTYHLYHKAPDYLGPAVSRALAIPYVVAEASHAPRQAAGRWATGCAAAAAAIATADAVIGFNPDDRDGVAPLLAAAARYRELPPFVDERPYRRQKPRRDGDGPPVLIVVAMMRPGNKLACYRLLAQALAALGDRPWRLLIVGDGPAQAAVQTALAPLAARCHWLGRQAPEVMPQLFAAADLCVWPAIDEPYGIAMLEAQAAGLPVVAGRARGVPAVVADGLTGVLTPAGRVMPFAAAIRRLLARPAVRRRLGTAAARRVGARHGIVSTAARLTAILNAVRAGPQG